MSTHLVSIVNLLITLEPNQNIFCELNHRAIFGIFTGEIRLQVAGVNIAEADRFVDHIKPIVKKTFTNAVLSGIGNFGAFYKPDFTKYKDPILVSSVDGVGTKLKIAAAMGIYDTIGEDLVNHCVNDIADVEQCQCSFLTITLLEC